MRFETMTPAQIARIIDLPLAEWPGRCNVVALLMLEAGLACGDMIGGRYHGVVAPGTLFSTRDPRCGIGHVWIELTDGRHLDPTRWAFEGVAPYLWCGAPTDYEPRRRVKVAPKVTEAPVPVST